MPTPSEKYSDIGAFQPGEDGWWFGKTGNHPGLKQRLTELGLDVIHRDLDANKGTYTPEDGAAFLAMDTGELYKGDGTQWTPAGAHRSKIRAVADTGIVSAIDPSSTPTPWKDAVGTVSAAGGGAVLLPPQTIHEQTGRLLLEPGVSIVGYPNVSEIVVDQDVSGVTIDGDDVRATQYCGFNVTAGVGSNNSTGAGIHITGNGSIADATFDKLRIREFQQGHVVDGDQFACTFPSIRFDNIAAGGTNGVIDYRTQGRPPAQYGLVHVYPSGANGTGDIVFNYNTEVSIRQLNVGGDAGRVINSDYGRIFVEQIHYEPVNQTSVPDSIVRVGGDRGSFVGNIKHHSGTADYGFIARGGPGYMDFGSYNAVDGSLNNNVALIDGSFEDPRGAIDIGCTHKEIDLNSVGGASRHYINPRGSRAMPLGTRTKSIAAGFSSNLSIPNASNDVPNMSTGLVTWTVTNASELSADYGLSIDKMWYDNSADAMKFGYSETENAASTNLEVDFIVWAK
ncbi:hypothetical protein V5735_01590 (plasmid) [Haladaptatus sp. SPP-AMP-3]|uniref:hypothetical protein n=1 Tax=Haladaptatus sp. SPP-AMP-3 TaxID=3121295 RepID=UPI003C2BD74D